MGFPVAEQTVLMWLDVCWCGKWKALVTRNHVSLGTGEEPRQREATGAKHCLGIMSARTINPSATMIQVSGGRSAPISFEASKATVSMSLTLARCR